MYLKRKIDQELERWLQNPFHSPALLTGIRQCGKTESIRHFANEHFAYVNEVNFWKNPDAKDCFGGALVVDDMIRSLSMEFPSFRFVPGKTLLFLDEIQDCPRARLALKSFKEDGRYQVIASGSYIGLNLVGEVLNATPKPNGAEDVFRMYTMDFQEFLWAKGVEEKSLDFLKEHFRNRTPIPEASHQRLLTLYREYLCVGGFPETVKIFLTQNSFKAAYDKNRSLIFDIKGDASKRKDEEGKPMFTVSEVARIQQAFDLVSSIALSENKRFVASRIDGNGLQRTNAVNYLINANVVFPVKNVTVPALPLSVNRIENDYKLFYADIGLLTASFDFDEIKATYYDALGLSKGYVYEAAIAESLYKQGMSLYYFGKSSGLKIDLVISYQGNATLVEAKAKSGNAKSAKMVLSHPEHYGKTKLLKIGAYNITSTGEILTMPYYLTYLLGDVEDDLPLTEPFVLGE